MEYIEHDVRPIGATFHYQKRKYHIVGHCEYYDPKTGYKIFIYIVKYYGIHKQWWHYEAMTAEAFNIYLKYGLIKEK